MTSRKYKPAQHYQGLSQSCQLRRRSRFPNPRIAWIEARRESEEAHLRRLIHQIDISALCARASLLRNGVICSASLPQEHESLVRTAIRWI